MYMYERVPLQHMYARVPVSVLLRSLCMRARLRVRVHVVHLCVCV